MKFFIAACLLCITPVLAQADQDLNKILWVVKLKQESPFKRHPAQYAVPLIADNMLYVGSASGNVYAIDRLKGKKIWKTDTKGAVYGGVALADNQVYVGDAKGVVYALDAASGKEIWHQDLGSDIMSTPLVNGSTLYLTTMAGQLAAINRATGTRLWQTPKRISTGEFTVRGSSSPVLFGKLVIAGFGDGSLVASDATTGNSVWERNLGGRTAMMHDVDGTPLLIGDRLYVGSVDGSLNCIQASSGQTIWAAPIPTPNDAALDNGTLYVTGNGTLYALNPGSGSILWKQDMKVPELSSPAPLRESIYTISTNEQGFWLAATDGKLNYKRYMGRGSFSKPVVVDGVMYILTNKGNLFAMEWK